MSFRLQVSSCADLDSDSIFNKLNNYYYLTHDQSCKNLKSETEAIVQATEQSVLGSHGDGELVKNKATLLFIDNVCLCDRKLERT